MQNEDKKDIWDYQWAFEIVKNKEDKFEHQEKPVIEQPNNV